MFFDAMDLAATFVFAISGATRGVRKQLDLFGVLVVAWLAGVAGGLARDLLIGAVPPAAIVDWRYLAATAAAGLLGFFASDIIDRLRTPVLLFDAAGLCLFAVVTGAALATVDDGRPRWWVVPLTWVWACTHGTWILGIAMTALVACAGLLDRRDDPLRRHLTRLAVPQ